MTATKPLTDADRAELREIGAAHARDRDQLWAEAAQRYADGEKHYLDIEAAHRGVGASTDRHHRR